MTTLKTVEEVAQKVIDIAFEQGCTVSKGHYDSFKEEINQERQSIHTSLVAAVEGRKKVENITSESESEYEYQVRNNRCVGYNQALDDTLTIINSIFKE